MNWSEHWSGFKASQAGRRFRSPAPLPHGPGSSIAHVEVNAQNDRNASVGIDSPFRGLPAALGGADWTQLVNRDALYHAVDLMELTVTAGSTVFIAHDDRLPRPPWLERQRFAPAGLTLTVLGRKMSLYRRDFPAETGLTLGPNTEDTSAQAGNRYLVFVQKGR